MATTPSWQNSSAYSMLSLGSALIQGWSARYTIKQNSRIQDNQYAYSTRMGTLNNELANQQAAIDNSLRAGSNRLMNAQANAENILRQISNKRLLARASDEHEQATENFLRSQEAMVQGSLEDQIAAAEQRGAYAAASALSGTLGTTIEGMEQTLNLKQNRAAEYQLRQNNYMTYDQLQQLAGIVPTAISQLDSGTTIPNLDYGVSFSQARSLAPAPVSQSPAGNFFTDAWSWALGNPDGFRQVGAGVSSWFTPKASDVPMFNALP